jgi:PadR family transcriptional regulator, regulatory protein PadR
VQVTLGPSCALPKDFLRSALLLLLREGEAHGYDLLQPVEAFGFDQSDPGGLYRTLRRLEAEGLVESAWQRSESGPPKRVYRITDAGEAELDRLAADLAEGERRIDAFLDRYLRARRLPASSARRRAVVGRFTAHRAATRARPPISGNGRNAGKPRVGRPNPGT